ncbi:Pvc16 family protein [Aeromonas jandaei]|uniref:Pvc16 family protein n=1 Tax=Aeromonas jandaei TaxID=650 RepID=UPI003B9DED87
MVAKVMSDNTIFKVNEALLNALKNYVDDGVEIRFDLPEPGSPPITPTVSVFLYDMHEDLRLNSSESRVYSAGRLLPNRINVSCNYLIMFWDKPATDGSSNGGPRNQAILVMNQVLNALVNNRQLHEIPGGYTKVIPPPEGLNSLGTFWQTLGNRPRLVLNYSVTVPISQTDLDEYVPEVVGSQYEAGPKK